MTVRLHHELIGPSDAPVVVLSSSIGTTAAMWDDQIPALRDRFRVLRYDHRGHGRSEVPPGPYALADLGADVLDLLDQLGVERASFCGLSMGGMVGMWLASHAPERIDHLVLACTAAHLGPAQVWDDRIALVRSAGMASLVDGVTQRWFTPGFVRDNPDAVARIAAMLEASDPNGYVACCAAIRDMDQRSALSTITAPTLVIAGADDPATPLDQAEAIHRGVAGSTLVVIDDAAHLANVQQPAAFDQALQSHLGGQR